MGLLDRIGAFDRYKVSPTQGTSGLLTGAQQPMSPFAQQAARQIGGALGMDMRTPNEKLTQGLSQIDPNDPQKMAKMYGLMVQFGTPEQKIAATQKLQELAQQKASAQQQERYRQSLIKTADSIGMGDLTAQITNASPDELRDLGKEIGKRQIQLAARGDDDRATEILAQNAGITPKELEATYGDDLPQFEEMEKILTVGDKGSTKAFVADDGRVRIYSVLGSKVLKDGKWQQASELGLRPAPQQVQTQELDGIFGKMPDSMKELVNETVSNTIKQGQEASDTLAENTRAQQLVADGIFTGLGADAIVEIARVGSFFGIDSPTLENTQAFALERFAKVADIIQAYGAGTGLSDADREFALAQAGVPTFEKATLERMLRIERQVAQFQLQKSREMIDKSVEEGLLTTGAAEILQLGRGSVPQPTVQLSPSAQQYIK
tara:strand:+ start:1525 stop:2829 length:1305 start_codon:yes stop_codon:yes gene_type:complete